VTLSQTNQPLPVVNMSAWGRGLDSFYVSSPGRGVLEVHPVRGVLCESLPPGAFVTAGPVLGSPFLANAGTEPLRFDMYPDRQPGYFGACTLGVGEPGQRIAAGTTLRFRVVTGFLTDGEKPGRVGWDLAESLNLGGGTAGYPLQVTTGKLVDANFALTLEAEAGEVQFTAGPRPMYLDLPVRIRGLADNGCVAFFEKKLGHFIFVPTVDGDALFQVAIDEGVDVWAGNVFVCDPPDLTLTLTGADEKKAQLEVHNPTDTPRRARITSPAHTPLFGGHAQEVDVPAGDSVFLKIPAP
jgi:hypothetical protein